MPNGTTAFDSRVGKADLTTTWGRLINIREFMREHMLLVFGDPLHLNPLICRSRTSERVAASF